MQQLRPYNQGQTHLAYRRTSWGLGGIDPGFYSLDATGQAIYNQLSIAAGQPTDAEILSGAITTPSNIQPSTGVPGGVMWVAIGFIVAMGMGLFDGPRKYGR
jgi:hypothetical protein